MCGIVVEHFKKETKSFVSEMLDAISHRGKDKVTIDNYVGFNVGFRRLAITEITKEPTCGEWKIYLNGEIYNYKDLGFEGCEVEVLSQGFAKYGLDFVHQLNGMFFIVAVYNGEVLCIRDRYGIKPAYYFENENVLLVASEIKSIVQHPEYVFKVNESAKRQWFVFNNVLTNETLFDGVFKIDKGSILSLKTRRTIKYWRWKFNPTPKDYEKAKHTIKALVTQAIERQKPSETKYTCCLSGGVDSNIISITLIEAKTFTAGFDGILDERHEAKLSGSINETVVFEKVTNFDKAIYHLEDLRAGASWSNYGLFERIAKEQGKVCFDGAGADELFGGYAWRYSAPNYYSVVNRTGLKDEYCEALFNKLFPVDTLENRYLFDCNYFLEGVLLVGDKMSMAHTIELRVPFLDNELVDFCLALPNEYKDGKRILKDAFKTDLPVEVLYGKKKGFSSPDWFGGEGNQALKWATAAFNEWEKQFKK